MTLSAPRFFTEPAKVTEFTEYSNVGNFNRLENVPFITFLEEFDGDDSEEAVGL